MKRRLFNLAAAVSLVLCLTAVGCWASSYLDETILVASIRGRLVVGGTDQMKTEVRRSYGDRSDRLILQEWERLGTGAGTGHNLLGFIHLRGMSTAPNRFTIWYWVVAVPYWFIVLPTAVLPAWWWLRRRKTCARRAAGRCSGCGYDLRGTPERCPECGTAVPAGKPAELVAQ
jgi:hypothetical protein